MTGSGDTVRVRALEADDWAAWDRFVEACPEATFFHRVGWRRVIEESFGHRTHYLLAESAAGIQGVLPLAHINSLLFGNALVSTPFCVTGGVAARDDAARAALTGAARALAERMGVDHLELRNRCNHQPDWPARDLYCTFERRIDADAEANLLAIPRKQRAEVRRAIRAGLTGHLDGDPAGACYDIYSESVRNLGTPVFSRRYFRLLKEVFGEACEGLVIRLGREPVAAVVSFYFRDRVLPYYGGGVAAARRLGGTQFLYWELMRRAGERGVAVFDFGRSKRGSGSYDFKRYFGFEPQPLHYQYHLVRAGGMPDLSPNNPKYRLFIQMWKRLPLPVSRLVGPWIARNLG